MNGERTKVGNMLALRQIVSADRLRVVSIVKSAGGYRFVEETHIHEQDAVIDHWFWELTHESGIYAIEQEAFDDAIRVIPWLRNSN